MENITVADIMTRDPIAIKPEMNLLLCAKRMIKKRVGSLLLIERKRLVGIITQKDILWALVKKSKKDLKTIKAIDISPKKIATINPNSNLDEAIKKMKKVKFDRLPVINKGELVGIITLRDILNFHPEIYSELDDFAKIREESRKLKRIKKAKTRESAHEGMCEECGNQDILTKIDGRLICESCQNAM